MQVRELRLQREGDQVCTPFRDGTGGVVFLPLPAPFLGGGVAADGLGCCGWKVRVKWSTRESPQMYTLSIDEFLMDINFASPKTLSASWKM